MDLSTALLAALALATANPERPVDPPVDRPLGPVLQAPRIAIAAPLALPDAPQRPGAPGVPAPRDTVIEYSKAYYTRLTIHRYASYAMLPLFVAQAYVGSKLYDGDEDKRDLHRGLAAGVGTLFAVNTTLGLTNLYAMRADPNDRRRRLTHATLMLLADAGFITTGILGARAADGEGDRDTHRAVALSSMAVSTVGWLIMTDLFRKD